MTDDAPDSGRRYDQRVRDRHIPLPSYGPVPGSRLFLDLQTSRSAGYHAGDMNIARERRDWDRSLVQLPPLRQESGASVAHPEPEGSAPDFRDRKRQAREAGRPADRTPCENRGVLRPQFERCDDRSDRVRGFEPQDQSRSPGRDPDGDRLDIESATQGDQLGLDRGSRPGSDERQAVEGRPHHLNMHAVRGPVRGSIGSRRIRRGSVPRRWIDLTGRIPLAPHATRPIPARRRPIGCRQNGADALVLGLCSAPPAPLSRSVVPGHEQTLRRPLINGSRGRSSQFARARPVRRAARLV